MAIDRADWHWDDAQKLYRQRRGIGENDSFTDEQEDEVWLYAGDHIGMFMQWLIDNGFEGEDSEAEDIERVRNGQWTGTEYLMNVCDGKFIYDDVREDVQEFVEDYYDGSKYFDDYANCCVGDDKEIYGVITDWETYLRLKARIDKAYKEFLKEH